MEKIVLHRRNSTERWIEWRGKFDPPATIEHLSVIPLADYEALKFVYHSLRAESDTATKVCERLEAELAISKADAKTIWLRELSVREELAAAKGELEELREAVSPGRINVDNHYYCAVATRMRRNEAEIRALDLTPPSERPKP
jgi:hypothetical protein